MEVMFGDVLQKFQQGSLTIHLTGMFFCTEPPQWGLGWREGLPEGSLWMEKLNWVKRKVQERKEVMPDEYL